MKARNVLVGLVERLAASPKIRKEASTFGWMHYIVQRRRIFHDCGIDLVIDVGANTGQFGADLRSFYQGEILSFEPVSAAYEKLAARAGADSRWKTCKLALAASNGERVINVSNKTVFSSFLKTNAYCEQQFGGISAQSAEETVAMRRLEEVLPELVPDFERRRIFLKMDTQGFDLEVFKGLGASSGLVAALQSEVSLIPIYQGMPHWTESVALYEAAGFGIAGMYPVSYDGASGIECDCLMVRRGTR